MLFCAVNETSLGVWNAQVVLVIFGGGKKGRGWTSITSPAPKGN